jgi:hypothetical protein
VIVDKLIAGGKRAPGGCFEWIKCRSKAGYGQIRIKRKLHYVHRLIWEIAEGPIPKGMSVCHTCDNPACFCVAHLFLGTHKENMADKSAKGRTSRVPGELCGKAKLTAAQVKAMKERRAAGERLDVIAAEYGIHPAHLSKIVAGKRWAHL